MNNLPPAKAPETKEAEAKLLPCPKCQGKPILLYTPGCIYSTCPKFERECPCIERAPDFDPALLVERINKRNQ